MSGIQEKQLKDAYLPISTVLSIPAKQTSYQSACMRNSAFTNFSRLVANKWFVQK